MKMEEIGRIDYIKDGYLTDIQTRMQSNGQTKLFTKLIRRQIDKKIRKRQKASKKNRQINEMQTKSMIVCWGILRTNESKALISA